MKKVESMLKIYADVDESDDLDERVDVIIDEVSTIMAAIMGGRSLSIYEYSEAGGEYREDKIAEVNFLDNNDGEEVFLMEGFREYLGQYLELEYLDIAEFVEVLYMQENPAYKIGLGY